MKAQVKIIEDYMSGTDEVFIRMNVLLLLHITEDKYAPVKEFCIDFKKDCAVESNEIVNKLRQLADKIEQNA